MEIIDHQGQHFVPIVTLPVLSIPFSMVQTVSTYHIENNERFNVNCPNPFSCTPLTDTGEDSKLVHRRIWSKVCRLFSSSFFRRVRATSMTQRRVEITLHTLAHFRLYRFTPRRPICRARQLYMFSDSQGRVSDVIQNRRRKTSL